MDTKKLRQKILDLAIRGKLVPQDPNDEPASVLLERIHTEKERLIAEGKINRSKKAKVSSSESHYQKFDIPDSWVWTTLGEISDSCLGKMLDKAKNHGHNKKYLRNLNVRWFDFDLSDLLEMPFEDNESDRYTIKQGDLVVCEGGEPGRCAIWDNEETIMFQKALHRIRILGNIPAYFIAFYFLYLSHTGKLNHYLTGSGIKHLTSESLANIAIPIPPLKEINQIVKSIQHWFSFIGEIETTQISMRVNIEFTKSKILELAMQGKLVSQDPADEPAADMLRRINPKARIITDNPHYPQLPGKWVLSTIKDVFIINPKNKADDDACAGFVPMALIEDGYSNCFKFELRKWGEIKSGFH